MTITRGPYSSIKKLKPVVYAMTRLGIGIDLVISNKVTGQEHERVELHRLIYEDIGGLMDSEEVHIECYAPHTSNICHDALEQWIDSTLCLAGLEG